MTHLLVGKALAHGMEFMAIVGAGESEIQRAGGQVGPGQAGNEVRAAITTLRLKSKDWQDGHVGKIPT